jgi:preprotein translocase subunit SecF
MKRVFDFMKTRVLMLIVSAVVIVGGIAGTVTQGGFNLGIDFQAGLSLTVDISRSVSVDEVRSALAEVDGVQVQRLGAPADNRFVVRVRDDGRTDEFVTVMTDRVLEDLRTAFSTARVEELETSYVGPRFSRDLTQQALFLTVFALVLILAYLWFRFRLGYAASSITALIHDVLVIIGVIGTFQLEVSTATIAAVLTIIGYSLNDTIVIFDRIRENEGLLRDSDFRTVINTSVTQSLSRTIITSFTTLLAVGAIYVFSTGTIQLFALTLIIGVLVGTYSSIFVASPVLLAWHTRADERRRKRETEKYHRGAINRTADTGAVEDSADKAQSPAARAVTVDAEAAKRQIAQQKSRKKKNRR